MAAATRGVHLAALDGWRGLSILLVLAAHLLPLGPKPWKLNYSAGILGMALFFTLSGFLITRALLRDQNVPAFLIRRCCRIVPLAWLYFAIALTLSSASVLTWLSHYLFYANFPPRQLLPLTLHLWSLCLEMQFYAAVALLVALLRVRGLWLLPLLCVVFTALRAHHGIYASDISYYRVDEILAGCTLALALHGKTAAPLLARLPQWPLLALLIVACLPVGGWFNYVRAYLAALLVGATLAAPGSSLVRSLDQPWLRQLALLSYALYVIHPLLAASWLGDGGLVEKYTKRPLLLLVLFVLAYWSTHHLERWFIERGRRWAARCSLPAPAQPKGEHDGV